jgi:hypothetical protein
LRIIYWQLFLIVPSLVFSQTGNENSIINKNYQAILTEMQQTNDNIQRSIELLHNNSTPKVNTRNIHTPQNNKALLSSIFFPGGGPSSSVYNRNTSYNYSSNKMKSNDKYTKDDSIQQPKDINKTPDTDHSYSTDTSNYSTSYPPTYNYQLPIEISFISSINTTKDPSSTNYTYYYNNTTPMQFTFNPSFRIEQNTTQYQNGLSTVLNEIQLTSTEDHISSTESNGMAIFTASQINQQTFSNANISSGNYYTPVFEFTATGTDGIKYQYSTNYTSIKCSNSSDNNKRTYCIQELEPLKQSVTLQS